MRIGSCRFCRKHVFDDYAEVGFKYGRRHYAHFECFLDRRPLDEVPEWVVPHIPYRILKERGMLEAAERIVSEYEARREREAA